MFQLIGKFNTESRQAFSGCIGDVFRAGRSHVGPNDIAATLVRAPSVDRVLRAADVDVAPLLEQLGAPAPGEGFYDKLRRALEKPEDAKAADLLSFRGGGMALPLTEEAKVVFEALQSRFASVPKESVAPADILATILQSSEELRAVFSKHQVTLTLLGGGEPGA